MNRFFLNSFRNLFLVLICVISLSANAQNSNDAYKEDLNAVELKLREGDFQGGLALLDQIAVKYPHVADIYYAKSLILGQMRDYNGAVENGVAAYQKRKNMFYANHLLELYKAKKDLNNSIALLLDLKSLYPNHEGLHRELMIIYAENEQLDEAKKLYSDLLSSNHSDTLNLVMSEIYMNSHDLQAAKNILTKLDGKSMIPDVYGYLGYIYMQDGKRKDAISVVERGIKRTNAKSLYLDLADMHKDQGRYELMYTALNTAFDAPDVVFWDKYKFLVGLMNSTAMISDEKLQNLANLLVQRHPDVLEGQVLKGELLWKGGHVEEARSIFLKVASSNPRYIAAWRLAINTDLALHQPDEAIKHGMEGLKHNPNNTELLYFTSLAHAAKLDYATSKDLLEAALNYSENDTNFLRSLIYSSLGDLYHELKMDSMSDVAYEEAITLDSTNVSALNNYAYYLAIRKKDLDKAADYSKLSNELEPNTATFMDTYAWVLFQQGKYQEALEWIEQAVKLNKNSAVLYEHYGDILSKLDRAKEAIVQWEKALRLEEEKSFGPNLVRIQEKIKEKKYVE